MNGAVQRLVRRLASSAGTRQSMVMAGAMVVAGGFDYVTNVFVGRLLAPAEFSVFVAVTAILQVMVHVTNVIRNVVAFYTAELTVHPAAIQRIGVFVRRRWRWAWRWGGMATAVMALLSPLLARLLQIDSPLPLWGASFALLLLFLRPVTDGALQGLQHFWGLSGVQVMQAALRLAFAILLIGIGWQAFGAIVALPLGSVFALLLALWLLRPYFRAARAGGVEAEEKTAVSWRYSTHTLIGLLAFALLVNVDAIMVKRFFSPEMAGNYGPVVTLGKMNLFIPLGIGLVLFPKATQRRALGQDARPVLLLALAATLAPGFLLTLAYFLAPELIVQTIFTAAYADPGVVLGLVGLATTLFAGVNIWLNYALSLERQAFIYGLAAVVIGQVIAILLYHDSFAAIATIMVAAGMAGNVWGALTTLRAPLE